MKNNNNANPRRHGSPKNRNPNLRRKKHHKKNNHPKDKGNNNNNKLLADMEDMEENEMDKILSPKSKVTQNKNKNKHSHHKKKCS